MVRLRPHRFEANRPGWHWRHWGPTAASRCPMIAARTVLADLFFRHTTTNRVEAHTDTDSIAERRALESSGFTREGILRTDPRPPRSP